MAIQQRIHQDEVSTDTIVEVRTRCSEGSEIAAGSWIRVGTDVVGTKIGKSCFVGFRSALHFADIGSGSMLAARVNLQGTPDKRICIGRNAWLGTSATVSAGVTIGDGAVVAAGALVTRDIPDDVVAVGRPARVLFKRQVIEDGFPDPAPILKRIQQRAEDGLPSFLRESSLSPERAIAENGVDTWRMASSVLIDAELSGGLSVSIRESCILIGRSTRTGGVSARGGIHFDDHVTVGASVIIEGAGGLLVGERCTIGSHATIVTSSHNHRFRSLPWVGAPVVIGPWCTIGEGVVIVGPVTIGAGATVEPYSVVIRDVQSGDTSRGVVSVKENVK